MKKLLAALIIFGVAASAYAADTKLSALTELASAPAESDQVYLNDGGVSKRITVINLLKALESSLTSYAIHADNLPTALGSIAGLTEADVSILEMTADNAYAVVTSGGANRLLGSNSDNSALEFKSSLTGLTFGGFSTTAGIAVTSDGSGNLTQSFTNLLPDAADGAALGSAAAEWSDLYLAAGGVIYGENDQANTLTSSATGWTANLNFAVTGQLSGRVPVVEDSNGKTLSGTDLYGSMQLATGAGTWTIPDVDAAAGTGQSFCIYVTGAYEVVIAGDAEDKIRLAGTLGAAGGDITNNTAEAAGDFICLMLTDFVSDVAHWTTLGYKGTWTVVP